MRSWKDDVAKVYVEPSQRSEADVACVKYTFQVRGIWHQWAAGQLGLVGEEELEEGPRSGRID